VVVLPLERDAGLRYHDWVAANRRLVDQRSGGRVGYVHLPNMGGEGLNEFARTYYPQTRKQALIVDVRWNGGGFVSEMILERLRRQVLGMVATRNAGEFTYPDAVQQGPKICLINQWSASDGDLFPHFFRRLGLGKLLGVRTWGGVVGIRGSENLVDGGYVYQPEFAYYDTNSTWMIENRGVEPDIELDNPPVEVLAGRDRQLERAIEQMVQAIDAKPPVLPARPADPTDR
jgi:tricorn protease